MSSRRTLYDASRGEHFQRTFIFARCQSATRYDSSRSLSFPRQKYREPRPPNCRRNVLDKKLTSSYASLRVSGVREMIRCSFARSGTTHEKRSRTRIIRRLFYRGKLVSVTQFSPRLMDFCSSPRSIANLRRGNGGEGGRKGGREVTG